MFPDWPRLCEGNTRIQNSRDIHHFELVCLIPVGVDDVFISYLSYSAQLSGIDGPAAANVGEDTCRLFPYAVISDIRRGGLFKFCFSRLIMTSWH
jgi:hypothetical protein